jgi:hypothetical protein
VKSAGILACFLLCTLANLAAQKTPAPTPLKLSQVRTIYVAPFGGELRNFIIQRLLKSKDLRLASSSGNADAILTGAAEASSGDTTYAANGAATTEIFSGEVTLVDRVTGKAIWSTRKGEKGGIAGGFLQGAIAAGAVPPGAARSQAQLADKIVKQLEKDWKKAQPKHAAEGGK